MTTTRTLRRPGRRRAQIKKRRTQSARKAQETAAAGEGEGAGGHGNSPGERNQEVERTIPGNMTAAAAALKRSHAQRTPRIDEVKHLIHLAQLRWQHGLLVGTFQESTRRHSIIAASATKKKPGTPMETSDAWRR